MPLGVGSSPRMRGSPRLCSHLRMGNGIIPAHAGLTIPVTSNPIVLRDHPRACGAHVDAIIDAWRVWGSSPRMRGSPPHPHHHLARPRIIPAHAGLTGGRFVASSTVWDHPRACGAHVIRLNAGIVSDDDPIGIIPAHAGLTVLRETTKS